MPDFLTTSLTGLQAFQRALDMTGHNIANASTPGYSRQVAYLAARVPEASGSGFVGTGVRISTIRRVYDGLLAEQQRTAVTAQSRLEMLSGLAGQLDGLLVNPATGLSQALQTFFNSVQDVANDPASLTAREALLGQAEGLLQRIQGIDQRLRQIDTEVNGRLRQAVDDVNRLSESLAAINERIVVGQGQTGQPPNDLLDQRDMLVREIAALVNVSTVMQDDGALNIFVGSGHALVMGGQARALAVAPDEFDAGRSTIVLQDTGGTMPLDSSLTGGALGGLLEFRSSVLDSTRESLGATALALGTAFNEQHRGGMDLRGMLGGDFFGLQPPAVRGSSGNAGSAAVTAAVTDVGALTGHQYVLEFDGSVYTLRDAETSQLVVMTGTGTPADPFLAEGLSLVTGGVAAAGDQFLIRPARDAAQGMTVAVNDVRSIAIAAPTRTRTSDANLGDARISQTEIVDAANPDLLTAVTIQFVAPSTYSINGAGAFAYVDGDAITINGSRFTISGTPQTSDVFTLEANSGGTGDNRNGRLLGAIQSRGILDGGTASINEYYGQLTASVGSTVSQVNANLAAQDAILANIDEAVAAKSGVNLDEEAARLLQFQQAYQALAQVVGVTSTLFETLLAVVRR